MAGSGVQRLRMARRSPRVLPIMKNPTHDGRYTGAPSCDDQMQPSAPAKPGTFLKYADRRNTKPKAVDHSLGDGNLARVKQQ